jgi:hypothetical protein
VRTFPSIARLIVHGTLYAIEGFLSKFLVQCNNFMHKLKRSETGTKFVCSSLTKWVLNVLKINLVTQNNPQGPDKDLNRYSIRNPGLEKKKLFMTSLYCTVYLISIYFANCSPELIILKRPLLEETKKL